MAILDKSSIEYQRGMGNWKAWGDDVAPIFVAAEEWRRNLSGVRLPWLCWNVQDDWCFLQQQLVESVGWTPVVGFDPRVGPPAKTTKNALVIDFNRHFGLPVLYPHFPLEFAFLFSERLAFWHSDLLVRLDKLEQVARVFEDLPQGSMAAVSSIGLRNMFDFTKQRYWELIGCTTRDASRSQYDNGCGWWLNFYDHVNRAINASDKDLRRYYWDHGTGALYWSRRHGGKVKKLREAEFSAGHFSQIKFNGYKRVSPNNEFRELSQDLTANFQLRRCAAKMGLLDLIGPE